MEQKIKDIKERYSNLNTQKTYITKQLTILKNKGELTEEEKEEQKLGRIAIENIKSKLIDKPKEPFIKKWQLEKLRAKWRKYDDSDKYKLIVGLYLYIPALRSDYINAKIENGFIVIPKMIKVQTIWPDGIKIKIPKELLPLIGSFELLSKNSHAFTQSLQTASKAIFNETFSIDFYRRCYTEWGLRKLTSTQNKQLAKDMNHSYEIHMSTYTPKTSIDYI